MSSNNQMGAGGQPLSAAVLPPNIFDPKLSGTDWYTYLVDGANSPAPTGAGANLAPAGVSNATISIDSGTDFYLVGLQGFGMDNADPANSYDSSEIQVTLQMNDSGSQRNLFSQPLPFPVIIGNGETPMRLIRPRLFRALSNIQFTFTNVSTAITFTHLWVALWGYRKYSGS